MRLEEAWLPMPLSDEKRKGAMLIVTTLGEIHMPPVILQVNC
jgi:hypothetical protein